MLKRDKRIEEQGVDVIRGLPEHAKELAQVADAAREHRGQFGQAILVRVELALQPIPAPLGFGDALLHVCQQRRLAVRGFAETLFALGVVPGFVRGLLAHPLVKLAHGLRLLGRGQRRAKEQGEGQPANGPRSAGLGR